VYGQITRAMMAALFLSPDAVYYQTLPAGICAISGIACVPAAVAMVYWRSVAPGSSAHKAVVV